KPFRKQFKCLILAFFPILFQLLLFFVIPLAELFVFRQFAHAVVGNDILLAVTFPLFRRPQFLPKQPVFVHKQRKCLGMLFFIWIFAPALSFIRLPEQKNHFIQDPIPLTVTGIIDQEPFLIF